MVAIDSIRFVRRFESLAMSGVFLFSSMGPGEVRKMSVGPRHTSFKGYGGRVSTVPGMHGADRRHLGIHRNGKRQRSSEISHVSPVNHQDWKEPLLSPVNEDAKSCTNHFEKGGCDVTGRT